MAEIVLSNIIALARHVGDSNMLMHQTVWKKVNRILLNAYRPTVLMPLLYRLPQNDMKFAARPLELLDTVMWDPN